MPSTNQTKITGHTTEISREHAILLVASFIRTITVGFGVTPNLPLSITQAARGLVKSFTYRRWGLSPRPEARQIISLFYLECNFAQERID